MLDTGVHADISLHMNAEAICSRGSQRVWGHTIFYPVNDWIHGERRAWSAVEAVSSTRSHEEPIIILSLWIFGQHTIIVVSAPIERDGSVHSSVSVDHSVALSFEC